MSTELFQGITDALEPLVRRFDLRVVRKVRQGNYTEVLFSNATTGLSVGVDWAEFRPFLRVIRLEDGRMPLEHEPNAAGEARTQSSALVATSRATPTASPSDTTSTGVSGGRNTPRSLRLDLAEALQRYTTA